MELVVECYRVSKKLPKSETYGLVSQLQRAAISIPANIAEGRERQHTKEFIQYLCIAYASLAELETYIEISLRLKYLNTEESSLLLGRAARVGRMLNGLRRSWKNAFDPRSPAPDPLNSCPRQGGPPWLVSVLAA